MTSLSKTGLDKVSKFLQQTAKFIYPILCHISEALEQRYPQLKNLTWKQYIQSKKCKHTQK